MSSANQRAPIALFVYNRADLTRQTLKALAANHGACDSDLVIFSDGAKGPGDRQQVADVRTLIANTQGFRSVRIVEAPVNRGLARSIISGVTALTQERGQVIVMEDDIITSAFFLDYLNDALAAYYDCEKVGAISGYIFPLDAEMPETFFLADESCWGWATWKRAWDKFEPDGKKLLDELKRRGQTRKFDVDGSFPFTKMLEDQIAGRNDSWAIRWRASLFLNDMLSLYPGKSLAKNIGTEGDGTHATQEDRLFDTPLCLAPIAVRPIPIEACEQAARAQRRYFRKNFAHGLRRRIVRKLKRTLGWQ